jgi:hypothetical protein
MMEIKSRFVKHDSKSNEKVKPKKTAAPQETKKEKCS